MYPSQPAHAVAEFVGDWSPTAGPGSGAAVGLLIEGEAGIGKSTLWHTGVRLAVDHGVRVLAASPTLAEADLAFTALGDLIGDVAGELATLPGPARAALRAARLGGDGAAPDPTGGEPGVRQLGAALCEVLCRLAEVGPVLVAIDDVPWLDRGSVEVLAFGLRRITSTHPVRVLACRRTGAALDEPGSAERSLPQPLRDAVSWRTLRLGPVHDEALLGLVGAELGGLGSLRLRRRVVKAAQGNPYQATELARALVATLSTGDSAGAPGAEPVDLPLPDTLGAVLDTRLAALSARSRTALTVVAALGRPTWETATSAVARQLGDAERAMFAVVRRAGDAEGALDEAVAAGVLVELPGAAGASGRCQPVHPLLGAAALAGLSPGARRRLHRELAVVVSDEEQRARHLALGGSAPDREVAAALDRGAATARRRGATHAAAELADLAVAFTAAEDGAHLAPRLLEATELNFAVGNLDRSAELGTALAGTDLSTVDWQRLLPVLVEAVYWVRGQPAAQQLLADLLDRPGRPARLRAVALACAVDVGDGRGTPREALLAEASALFEELGDPDPALLSTALVCLSDERLDRGEGMAVDLLDRAVRAERAGDRWIPVCNRAVACRGYQRKIVDDLDGARVDLLGLVDLARDEGDDTSLPALLGHLALTEYWAGDYPAGLAAAQDGLTRATAGRGVAPAALYAARALLAVVTGDATTARQLVTGQLRADAAPPGKKAIVYRHVLGLAALLDGDAAEAIHHLDEAWRLAGKLGVVEPGRRQRLEADVGEALVATGQLDRAGELARQQREFGERTGRPTITGIGWRIEGMALAATGELDAAQRALEEAVAAHRFSPLRLELPRSLLALGRVQRRARSRRLARETLDAALAGFTDLGAVPFVGLARAELDRLGGRHAGNRLTATEDRVALLAGKQRTNQEIASELFISVRTVEGHLANVYRKLGVTGRRDLFGYPSG